MAKHPVAALTLAVCFLLCPFGAKADIADMIRKHDHGTREERGSTVGAFRMVRVPTVIRFGQAGSDLFSVALNKPQYVFKSGGCYDKFPEPFFPILIALDKYKYMTNIIFELFSSAADEQAIFSDCTSVFHQI